MEETKMVMRRPPITPSAGFPDRSGGIGIPALAAFMVVTEDGAGGEKRQSKSSRRYLCSHPDRLDPDGGSQRDDSWAALCT